MKKLEVRKNTYYDSVTLMIISKEVKTVDGVNEALVGMGTDLNQELVKNLHLAAPGFEEVTANDFFVAADCDSDEAFAAAVAKVDELLSKKASKGKSDYFPPTLEGALKVNPDLNMAIISVPGRHAAGVAQSCLDHNINVMLFSDNVTIEEEKELKENAAAKELLMMGPDCGTAILDGVGLAFSNVVKHGPVGVVAASGTGMQEVTSLLDAANVGVSQAIGTGGRDLSDEVGGIMTLDAVKLLAEDDETRVIAVIGKACSESVAAKLENALAAAQKPAELFVASAHVDHPDAPALGENAQGKLVHDDGLPGAGFSDDRSREAPRSAGEGVDVKEVPSAREKRKKRLSQEITGIRGFTSGGIAFRSSSCCPVRLSD